VAAQAELMRFRERVHDLEGQLRASGSAIKRKALRSEEYSASGAVISGGAGATGQLTTAVAYPTGEGSGLTASAASASAAASSPEDHQLRPHKRAALEQRLRQLQSDTTAAAAAVFGTGSTPQRAAGFPVPGSGPSAAALANADILAASAEPIMTESDTSGDSGAAAARSGPGADMRTSARRGTYYGLCE
jgi:hypothetical protein